jgi:hypothetical protein
MVVSPIVVALILRCPVTRNQANQADSPARASLPVPSGPPALRRSIRGPIPHPSSQIRMTL